MVGHPLYPYRLGPIQRHAPNITRKPDPVTGMDYRVDTPIQQAKAIRATCLDCAGSPSAVRNCRFNDCALYEFRLGRVEKRSPEAISDTNATREGKDTTPAVKSQKHAPQRAEEEDL